MAKLHIYALLVAAGFTIIPSTVRAQETTATAASDFSAVIEPAQGPEYRDETTETQKMVGESAETTAPNLLAIPKSTTVPEISSKDTVSDDTESTISTDTGGQPTVEAAENQTSVTLPEGVVYQVTKEGNGPQPGTTSTLLIHYTLYLADGPKVESSRDAEFPLPFQFSVGQGDAIEGMELGTAGMQVGERRKIFIPAEVGYGAKGHGKNIPPKTDLVFDVELVDIK